MSNYTVDVETPRVYLKNVNEHFSIKRFTLFIHILMSVDFEYYCFAGFNILTLVKVLPRIEQPTASTL